MSDDLNATVEKAHEAWRRKWEREKPEEPERDMRYTVTLKCTYSEFESVVLALSGFCEGRKWFRQEEW